MRRSQRVAYTVATVPTQVACGGVLAVVLARVGKRNDTGWGDLVGVVVGVVLGAGIGLALVLVLVARTQRRPLWHRALQTVAALPSALLAGALGGLIGVEFWTSFFVYLAVGVGLVWWLTGRVATVDTAAVHR